MPYGLWDLSFSTRDWTIKAWSPNHWTAKEFPKLLFKKKKKDIGPCCSILGHSFHFLSHSESSPVKEGTSLSFWPFWRAPGFSALDLTLSLASVFSFLVPLAPCWLGLLWSVRWAQPLQCPPNELPVSCFCSFCGQKYLAKILIHTYFFLKFIYV